MCGPKSSSLQSVLKLSLFLAWGVISSLPRLLAYQIVIIFFRILTYFPSCFSVSGLVKKRCHAHVSLTLHLWLHGLSTHSRHYPQSISIEATVAASEWKWLNRYSENKRGKSILMSLFKIWSKCLSEEDGYRTLDNSFSSKWTAERSYKTLSSQPAHQPATPPAHSNNLSNYSLIKKRDLNHMKKLWSITGSPACCYGIFHSSLSHTSTCFSHLIHIHNHLSIKEVLIHYNCLCVNARL